MVQFTKLRLHGFKSFVDPTVMEIGAGITGIVGPNGCGKSNLVEALRWVMGETSAKRMRGAGMDDVIFNGTKSKPARNTAEVTLWLDNSDRTAPAELNHSDELETIRHIEKENGSTYRVNGKIVRARDVQLLFADASIGAHSPAMVSQGRVADLISAKPTQRRLVLEEAAGISGLHARKHEAELKLRAAENNLTRAEDVLGTMDLQMQGLKKQARQASRYRNLSGHIKHAEALVLYLQWQQTDTAVLQARNAFKNADDAVREHTLNVTRLTKDHTNQSTVLPELRKNEAESAASLQRLKLAHGLLEKEVQQLDDTLRQNTSFLEQVNADMLHEQEGLTDIQTSIQQLTSEIEDFQSSENGQESTSLQNALENLTKLQKTVQLIQDDYSENEQNLQNNAAHKQRLTQILENSQTQTARLSVRLAHLQHKQSELKNNIPDNAEEEKLFKYISEKEIEINRIKEKVEKLDKDKLSAEIAVEDALAITQNKQNSYAKLTTEIATLEQILQSRNIANDAEPILGKIDVKDGMEKALAVALGDDAEATEDANAPVYWTTLPEFQMAPALPQGVKTLSAFVKAPKALARRLSMIGVIDTDKQAAILAKDLQPGQCLVTKEGSAWRWDGLVITANAPSTSAVRLEQKNKLAACQKAVLDSEKSLQEAENISSKARRIRDDVSQSIMDLRDTLRGKEQDLHNVRQEYSRLSGQNTDIKARITALDNNITDTNHELEIAKENEKQAKADLSEIVDDSQAQQKLEMLKEQLQDQLQEQAKQQSQYDRLLGAEEMRKQRLTNMQNDLESWKMRQTRLTERLENLQERKIQALTQKEELTARPSKMNDDLQSLLTQTSMAEKKRNLSADTLAKAESKMQTLQQQLKHEESELSDAREARAHAGATVSTAQQTQEMILQQISEKFSTNINGMMQSVDINPEEDDLPELDAIHTKLERLLRERENMGPVNLRADIESQELIEQMDTITSEKDDLVSAIGRLRQGINKLNKEARERLLQAFEVVNKHFSDLFTRLFEGGAAHLQLTDTEDPLEAGLEIYAQPPGKKMQVLSLFSGGEQTLTSIALIFAMFLTNPAPICVLDEIDAPLDDSNVDRVCTLLEQIAKETSTRFIVISHHRMTMARMDRLYGVTMGEKGISQLVSVDLQQPSLLDHLAA